MRRQQLAAALAIAAFLPAACGGGGGSQASSGSVAIAAAPAPAPSPTPSPSAKPSDPPATNLRPPAPFGLTSSADLALVGWQQTSQSGSIRLVAPAEQKGTLAWSAGLKTYAIGLADLAVGSLVYTFPPPGNLAAFSIIQADGAIAPVYVTIFLRTASVGELYWQSADGITPFVYAHAFFGLPVDPRQLPASGRRVFVTDTSPQSSIVFDFATRKVSGTVTSFDDGGSWNPQGPKEQATLEPTDLLPDGSFIAAISVPGAPKKGELRGRLLGRTGDELAVYWNAPVRDGFDGAFGDWLAVMAYPSCTSCVD